MQNPPKQWPWFGKTRSADGIPGILGQFPIRVSRPVTFRPCSTPAAALGWPSSILSRPPWWHGTGKGRVEVPPEGGGRLICTFRGCLQNPKIFSTTFESFSVLVLIMNSQRATLPRRQGSSKYSMQWGWGGCGWKSAGNVFFGRVSGEIQHAFFRMIHTP